MVCSRVYYRHVCGASNVAARSLWWCGCRVALGGAGVVAGVVARKMRSQFEWNGHDWIRFEVGDFVSFCNRCWRDNSQFRLFVCRKCLCLRCEALHPFWPCIYDLGVKYVGTRRMWRNHVLDRMHYFFDDPEHEDFDGDESSPWREALAAE